MDAVDSSTLTEMYMMANGKTTRGMDTVFILGQTAGNTTANGKTANRMAKDDMSS